MALFNDVLSASISGNIYVNYNILIILNYKCNITIFQIVLDTIMIALRTATFVFLIIYNPENALFAFGVAQLIASIFCTVSHYIYFHYYIKKVKKHKLKRRLSVSDDGTEEYVESEFPFMSIKDFLPGQLENHVHMPYKLIISLLTF
jgi:hypothetical protein